MANEHVLVIQKTIPISMRINDSLGVEKGTVLTLVDPFTASGSTGLDRANIAGIAYTEKIASTGDSCIAVLTGPGDVLRATASGSITVGDALMLEGDTANTLISANSFVGLSGGKIIGISGETATTGQTFLYTLNIQNAQG